MNSKVVRVLHVVDNLSITAGVSSMIMNLYRNIDSQKIIFDFLVGRHVEKNYESEIESLGGRVYYFGNPLSARGFISANRKSREFFRANSDKYDIVHLHSPTICEFTVRYAKQYGIKHIIIHSHSSMTSTNRFKSIINSILQRRVTYLATDYWACSTEAGSFLFGDKSVKDGKVSIIYNAVSTNLYTYNESYRRKMRRELCLENKLIVTHVAGFFSIKNHSFLLPIIASIKQTAPNIRFVFVGAGPEQESFIESLKRTNNYDVCSFLGRRDDVYAILQASDLLILPSIKEGLPVTIIEGQAAGIPCLVSDSITKDALVNNVTYIPLNTEYWEEYIRDFIPLTNEQRMSKSREFEKSHFNIIEEAKRVQDKYIELVVEK